MSVYEAIHIQSILECRDKRMDNTPLWYMFVTAAVQLLMVINASFNLPIYFFAGQHFRDALSDTLSCRFETGKCSHDLLTYLLFRSESKLVTMGESMKKRKNNLSVKSKINEVNEDGAMIKKETSAELKAENASVVNVTNL